jgi:hypothetical protein
VSATHKHLLLLQAFESPQSCRREAGLEPRHKLFELALGDLRVCNVVACNAHLRVLSQEEIPHFQDALLGKDSDSLRGGLVLSKLAVLHDFFNCIMSYSKSRVDWT